jgi:fructose-1,6-bisphosphatase II
VSRRPGFLIADGDVAGAIVAARTQVDRCSGSAARPRVIAASALKCLGGSMQGKLYPRDDNERRALLEEGYDLDRVLHTDDLVASDDVFFAATGVTDGYLLDGVTYWPDGATTYSMVMRSRSGTIRSVRSAII